MRGCASRSSRALRERWAGSVLNNTHARAHTHMCMYIIYIIVQFLFKKNNVALKSSFRARFFLSRGSPAVIS